MDSRPPQSSISLEAAADAQNGQMEPNVKAEIPRPGTCYISADPLFGSPATVTESRAALGTGAAVDLASSQRLQHHAATLGRLWIPTAEPCPARAKFKFGNCRVDAEGVAAQRASGREFWGIRKGKAMPVRWRGQGWWVDTTAPHAIDGYTKKCLLV